MRGLKIDAAGAPPIPPKLLAATLSEPKPETAFTFEDHCALMDAKHPDWRRNAATSYTAVAKEFWEAALASMALMEPDAPSDNAQDVLQKCAKALDPFAQLATAFDIEPYKKDYPDDLQLRDNATVKFHNFLTLGDCRRAKTARNQAELLLVAPSVVAGVGEHESGVSSDEEIARESANAFLRQHGDGSLQGFLYLDLLKAFQVAIRKAKSLSEPKEQKLRIDDVPGGYNLMFGDEKLLHSIHDNLLPQMQRLVQVFSEPKESEEEKQ